MEIHENIKFLREKLGLSQEELAIKVGYKDRSSIAKVEAGLVDLPQSKIAAFAAALHVPPVELMGITDKDRTPIIEKQNIIRIAGRDGSYQERILSDSQLAALTAILDQMPDVPDDL